MAQQNIQQLTVGDVGDEMFVHRQLR